MSKTILGLDLGITSIGWANVIEGKTKEESVIKQLGVRITQLDNFVSTDTGKEAKDPLKDFASGNGISPNAGRTLKRGARRNLDRYQMRRKNLFDALTKATLISDSIILNENGKDTTHETWQLRAKAAKEEIELSEFVRILFAINKKRGYKSSRKTKNDEDGQAIDGMSIAKKMSDENLTPGQLVFQRMIEGVKVIPDFYRSDLQAEFEKVWNFQKQFYPDILTDKFYSLIQGKGQKATSTAFWSQYQFNTADIKELEDPLKTVKTIKFSKRDQKKLQAYKWRNDAITQQLEKEQMAYVITEINNDLNKSSGYLGAISDRSKELYFNKITVGEYLYNQIKENPHTSLKNQVFYRQDYLDEFETLWEVQSKFHPQLTEKLKAEIRDIVIFYQRKLKSQKGLISFCEFESKEVEIDGKKKTIGSRVAPKSSPLFQEFKIWQNLNHVVIRKKGNKKQILKDVNQEFYLDDESKELLFEELNLKGNLKANDIFKILGYEPKDWEINYTQLEGNRTNQALYNAFLKILEIEGYNEDLLKLSDKDEINVSDLKTPSSEIKDMVKSIFEVLEINTEILDFDAELDGKDFEKQASYQFWHLLYSAEDDSKKYSEEDIIKYGNNDIGLKKNLCSKFGFQPEHAKILVNVSFQDDYGNLSTKAMRNIFPFIMENEYSTACELAGYRHSKHSLTKEELENRELKPKLELLTKNSLRNPVVEKVLNQMVNVVNTLIDKENEKLKEEGKPESFHFDEIRIELARELKKSASERAEMTEGINKSKIAYEKIHKILQNEFGIKNPTRNDIIRYRLYEELKNNGYKDLYTNEYIPRELLFSKSVDIEHILPQSKLFDDSFSNKTVVFRKDNLEKGNQTAIDYIANKFHEDGVIAYMQRVENLFKDKSISKAKYQKLIKKESEIGDGFIERDLRDSQYIAKKAKEILFQITKSVVSTSGSVTNRLRDDWGLINIMKELNLPKYRAVGMTELEERKHGQKIEVIKDWTKRDDHRHHAMDALTIAFTKHSHIQYLNYLNARKNENHELHKTILRIENLETEWQKDDNGNKKRVFIEPITNFRHKAKEHLENILISHKAKNKVVTKNKNKITGSAMPQETLTPRGQLHKETVYGKYSFYTSKEEKVSAKFDADILEKVSNPLFRKALKIRLAANNNDPKKAFTGKNALAKNPIFLNEEKTITLPEKVKLVWLEEDYSVRKKVNPENFKDTKSLEKILDKGVKRILHKRLVEFGLDSKKAFSDLEINPIWLNKEKGISIKNVRISGIKNAEALHYKKDHFGKSILDMYGNKIPVDFISTGNNHHVAIYKDEKGNLQENVVSFYEAVERVNQGLPIIDKYLNHDLGWTFLFTMKQNEMFVFPNENEGFDPMEVDLLNPKNKNIISPHLFRVQKISTKNYVFNHHLETISISGEILKNKKELIGIMYYFIQTPIHLRNIIKVRINHLGDIVSIGEY